MSLRIEYSPTVHCLQQNIRGICNRLEALINSGNEEKYVDAVPMLTSIVIAIDRRLQQFQATNLIRIMTSCPRTIDQVYTQSTLLYNTLFDVAHVDIEPVPEPIRVIPNTRSRGTKRIEGRSPDTGGGKRRCV